MNKIINFRLQYFLIPFMLVSFLLASTAYADDYDDEILQPRIINQLTIPLQTWALEFNFSNYEGYEWFDINEMGGSVELYNKSDYTNLDITAKRGIENVNDKICFDYFVELNKKRDENFYFASLVDGNTPYFEYSMNMYKAITRELVEEGGDAKNMAIGTTFVIDDACVQILASDLHNDIFYNNRLNYLKNVLSNLKINRNYKQTIYDILRYGNHYFYRREYELASKYLNKILNAEKTDPELNQKDFQTLIINLSRSYIRLGNLEKAEDVLLFGIEKDPTNPLFYYNLAVVSAEKDDFNATFKNLWKAYTYEENLNPFDSPPDPLEEIAFQKYANEDRFIEYLYSLNKRHSIIMIEIGRNYSIIRDAFEDEYNPFKFIRVEDNYGNQYHLDQFGNRFYKEDYKSITHYNGYGYNSYDINAFAEDHQGNFASIDSDGNIIDNNSFWEHPKNDYGEIVKFSEGIGVEEDSNGEYHVDMDGNRLYEENYVIVGYFKDGIAPVRGMDGLYLYIDIKGNPIFDQKFEGKIWPFYQDRARITDQFSGSYHINREGKRLYSESYDSVDNFYEDRAKVRDYDGNYFHIDLNGKRAYPENYVWVDKYSDGFARVKDELGNWYHIDKNGKELYKERYDWVGNFIDGIAPIQSDAGTIEFIDTNGDFVRKQPILTTNTHKIIEADNDDEWAFFTAVKANDSAKLSLLIEKGVDINVRNLVGESPLHYAAADDNVSIAELLIDNGADIHSKTYDGQTPLNEAIKEGSLGVIQLLLSKGVDIELTGEFDSTPLHCAVAKGDIKIIKLLLSKGAKVDVIDSDGRNISALRGATQMCSKEIANELIKFGANVNYIEDMNGRTLLHEAADIGCIDLINLLIDNGADINIKDFYGRDALHPAVFNGHVDAAKLLIEKGFDVNSQNDGKETPLHYATRQQNVDMVDLLVQAGADCNIENERGETALEYAIATNNQDIINILKNEGVIMNERIDVLKSALAEGDFIVVRLLFENGFDINITNDLGETSLHIAILNSHDDIARILLMAGADPNAKTVNGDTPLHYAMKSNSKNIEIMTVNLIQSGAIVNQKNSDGNTPLHIASQEDFYMAVDQLTDFTTPLYKVDINALNNNGKTALDLAKSDSVKDVLIKKGAKYSYELNNQ